MKLAILRTSFLGPALLAPLRLKTAMGYFKEPARNLIRWLHSSNETTNFTYDLEEANKQYLASLLAVVLSISYDQAISYIREIEEDEELKNHIARATAQSEWSFRADPEVRLGRRMGWYVIARVLKPKVIVETGVDKGLGACVLTAALKRNKEESFDGRYYGTDIDSRAGYLLSGQYARFGSILFGDSIDSLKKLEGPIDLFINDSDHSTDYEANEYEIISDKLSRHAIVLGDNSHCSDKLLSFSFKHNRNFVFFQEKPRNHWYPGGGIGISFLR